MKTFASLLEELSQNNVKYILIGGLAVDICGFSRATIDADIIIEPSEENIARMLDCLSKFGNGSSKELSAKDFPIEEGCIRIVEEFPLDVFTLIKEKTYSDLLHYMETFKTDNNIGIPYLNSEGLIYLKEDSLRPKDQLDVQELRKLKK